MSIQNLFSNAKWNKVNFRIQLTKMMQAFFIFVFLTSTVGVNPTSVTAAPLSYGTMTPACGGGVFPCSVWGMSGTPQTPNQRNLPSIELGMKFRTDVNGEIQGIRFYKGSSFSGDFTGHLWDTAGNPLATTESINFTGDTSTGWKELAFLAPYPVLPIQPMSRHSSLQQAISILQPISIVSRAKASTNPRCTF
jgi:hypothetical protein